MPYGLDAAGNYVVVLLEDPPSEFYSGSPGRVLPANRIAPALGRGHPPSLATHAKDAKPNSPPYQRRRPRRQCSVSPPTGTSFPSTTAARTDVKVTPDANQAAGHRSKMSSLETRRLRRGDLVRSHLKSFQDHRRLRTPSPTTAKLRRTTRRVGHHGRRQGRPRPNSPTASHPLITRLGPRPWSRACDRRRFAAPIFAGRLALYARLRAPPNAVDTPSLASPAVSSARETWNSTFTTPNGIRLDLDLATYPDCCAAMGRCELDAIRILRRLTFTGNGSSMAVAWLGFTSPCAAQSSSGPYRPVSIPTSPTPKIGAGLRIASDRQRLPATRLRSPRRPLRSPPAPSTSSIPPPPLPPQ